VDEKEKELFQWLRRKMPFIVTHRELSLKYIVGTKENPEMVN
jgi:predicted ATPase with chaperone activity